MYAERVDVQQQGRTVDRDNRSLSGHLNRSRDHSFDAGNHRARLVARNQRSIPSIRAIGKSLRNDTQAKCATGYGKRRSRRPIQRQFGIGGKHRTRDRLGKLPVVRRHVVQRAVRLHMSQAQTLGVGHTADRGDLIEH